MLERSRAALVVVDVQEAFRKAIPDFDATAREVGRLMAGARILGVPIVVTEQYPRGLGRTVDELGLEDETIVQKTVFSACRAEGFDLAGREQVPLCGIEAHVCVSQTAHDLLEQGIEVHVACDAVSSRTAGNKQVGLHKMEHAGAVLSSVETALLELCERAGTPEFKAVQEVIM